MRRLMRRERKCRLPYSDLVGVKCLPDNREICRQGAAGDQHRPSNHQSISQIMGISLNSYPSWRRGGVRESVAGSNLRYARPDLEVPAKLSISPASAGKQTERCVWNVLQSYLKATGGRFL